VPAAQPQRDRKDDSYILATTATAAAKRTTAAAEPAMTTRNRKSSGGKAEVCACARARTHVQAAQPMLENGTEQSSRTSIAHLPLPISSLAVGGRAITESRVTFGGDSLLDYTVSQVSHARRFVPGNSQADDTHGRR
jgi:hypothetical protein